MNSLAVHILRIGLGATFILIGFSVWAAPEAWGSFVQPWALAFLPKDIASFMKSTAIVDMFLGVWMLVNRGTWIAALVASLHVLVILITTTTMGVIIERDVAIFAATLALFLDTMPHTIQKMLRLT